MLQLRRKLKQRENKGALQGKPFESLEQRQLLTAAPSLDGVTVDRVNHTAVIWFNATANTGSDTVWFQSSDGPGDWDDIGTTAGGVHALVPLNSVDLSSSVTMFRAKTIHLGVDSAWSNTINVETSTAVPCTPAVEDVETFGSTTDIYFSWTGSTGYTEDDTLLVQYATTTTAGTVWNDYTSKPATAPEYVDVNGLDFSQTTTLRISVENSNGQSSWNEFSVPPLY